MVDIAFSVTRVHGNGRQFRFSLNLEASFQINKQYIYKILTREKSFRFCCLLWKRYLELLLSQMICFFVWVSYLTLFWYYSLYHHHMVSAFCWNCNQDVASLFFLYDILSDDKETKKTGYSFRETIIFLSFWFGFLDYQPIQNIN